LRAGIRAKSSNAYQSAAQFFGVAQELIYEDDWENHYEINLELSAAMTEIGFLLSDRQMLEEQSGRVIENGKRLLDKVRTYEILARDAHSRGELQKAVSIILDVLGQLGMKLPANPGKLDVIRSLLKTKACLSRKTTEDILNAPQMTDQHMVWAVQISYQAGAMMYYTSRELMAINTFLRLQLILNHGNAPASYSAFNGYGLILCGILRKFDQGYAYARLAMDLLDKYNLREYRGPANFRFNAFVRHYKEPLINCLEPLKESHRECLEVGDLNNASHPVLSYAYSSLLSGQPMVDHLPTIDSFIHGLTRIDR